MEKIYKLKHESISKLRIAIKSEDFETNFRVKYLSGSDNGFTSEDLELLPGNYEIPAIALKADKKGKYDF